MPAKAAIKLNKDLLEANNANNIDPTLTKYLSSTKTLATRESFNMLGKILNLGKKKDFYLTIDETKPAVSEAVENISETVSEVASETVNKVTEVIESAPSPEEIVEPVTEPTKSSATKAKAKVSKKTTTKAKSDQKTAKKPAVPAYSGASSWEEPFWVKAMYNTSSSSNGTTGEKSEATFATDYLMVQSGSRRRPGPSLNKFKAMVNKKKF